MVIIIVFVIDPVVVAAAVVAIVVVVGHVVAVVAVFERVSRVFDFHKHAFVILVFNKLLLFINKKPTSFVIPQLNISPSTICTKNLYCYTF